VTEAEHLAREFYKHLAAAIGVHAKFGQMRMRLERAGVDAGCLYDFAKDLLGSPEKRDDHAGFALRDAVRRNFIDKSDVPAGYV
jgi:hypothetical protein